MNWKKIVNLMFVLIFVCFTRNSYSESSNFSLHLGIGLAKTPMTDWKNAFGDFPHSDYKPDEFLKNYSFEIEYYFDNNHSILFEISQMNYEINTYGVMFYVDENAQVTNHAFDRINHSFSTVPITLGYKYSISSFYIPLYCFTKIGYYIIEINANIDFIYDPWGSFESIIGNQSNSGNGYGIILGLGLKIPLKNNFNFLPEISYKHIDSMYFTDKKETVDKNFSGFYFSLKVGIDL